MIYFLNPFTLLLQHFPMLYISVLLCGFVQLLLTCMQMTKVTDYCKIIARHDVLYIVKVET